MDNHLRINRRAREIGLDIFERAHAARPRIRQKSWWLEQMTRVVDRDERLKTRAFQFVDCLPALRDTRAIAQHLAEYLDPRYVHMPAILPALLKPGRFQRWREELVGRLAQFGAKQMAARFIAGYDVPSVLNTLRRLRREGMAFTIDVLGESTTSYSRADAYASIYHELIDPLSVANEWPTVPAIDRDAERAMPRVNLSIKLSGLDPHFDAIDADRAIREVGARLRPLLRYARDAGAFVNVDMESTKYRRITLDLFRNLLMEEEFRDWPDVGIVVQAYLREGERDLAELLEWGERRGKRFAIRLVKGAYWDAETAAAVRNYKQPPVWTHKWESDACYERMTRVMLEHVDLIRPCFGSHNVRSLAVALATAEELGVLPAQYEVQMLYGMGDPLKTAMVQLGQCVRVYCPYGDLMPGMSYLIRRLLENTSNDSFLRQGFGDRGTYDRLLQDPAVARQPSSPPPARAYRNPDPKEPMTAFVNASNTDFSSAENRSKMIGAIAYVRGEAAGGFGLGRSHPLVINHESVATEAWYDSVNPSRPSEVVGRVARATPADVERSVAAARKASVSWRHTPAAVRADLLRKISDRLEMRRFELAATMILEAGKPWREADAEVTEAIDHCRYYAEQIERIAARPRLRNLPGEDNMLTYSPKGVCAVIAPFAFPLAILTGMTAAALAAGNTVVLKPAGQGSIVAAKFMEILQQAGIPAGAANYLPGPGAEIGHHLVEHEDVNVVAFTGSREVGTAVIRTGAVTRPGQAFIKKMIVEMGGKNAMIIDDDADLDGAVQAVIDSAFSYAGQKCSSCSRLIVLEGVHEALTDRLGEAVASLPIGPAEEPSTIVGPLIDSDACARVRSYVQTARMEGRLLVEATLPPACGDGFFAAPMVFTEVTPDARIAQEEIFGPLLAVIRANDFDHALKIANGTRYALTGGLFSRSPANIERARQEFAVGNLYINRRITGSQVDVQPFGGFKLSGTGVKAGSPDYLLHFMDARCITENTLRSGLVPPPGRSRDDKHTSAT